MTYRGITDTYEHWADVARIGTGLLLAMWLGIIGLWARQTISRARKLFKRVEEE